MRRLTRALSGNDRLSDIPATTLTGYSWPIAPVHAPRRNGRSRGEADGQRPRVYDREGSMPALEVCFLSSFFRGNLKNAQGIVLSKCLECDLIAQCPMDRSAVSDT
jgi:hypothetical protein